MPCIAYLAFPVVARFLCGGRKGTFAYIVGQLSMLAVAACALVFGAMLVGTLTREDSDEEDKLGTLRAALAGLIVLAVVLTAVRLLWLLR